MPAPHDDNAQFDQSPYAPGIRRIAPAGSGERTGGRSRQPPRRRLNPWAALALTGLVFGLWLIGTPEGVYGKTWAIGYAVCHQIPARSFLLGPQAEGATMPLCARCTGTYLGVMVGFLAPLLLRRGRAGKLPHWSVLAALGLFTLVMAVDGVNSYLNLFPSGSPLYQPSNELRLLTGSLHGLTMASILYPVFNQSTWLRWRQERSLRHLGDLALLVIAVLALDLLVLTREPLALQVLSLVSTGGVVAVLMAINTVLVVTLTRRDQSARDWGDLAVPLIVAFGLTFMLIGFMNAGRFALFGSWEGVPLGG